MATLAVATWTDPTTALWIQIIVIMVVFAIVLVVRPRERS
jgi:hypothetical protein